MKVSPIKLIDSEGINLSLTIGKIYEVLGIEANYYRILSDPGSKPYGNDPVLYDPECFEIIDLKEPEFWLCKREDDDERYCYPPEWNEIGFFEDYHDGIADIRKVFWDVLKTYYPETWNERKASANNSVQWTRSPRH